MNKDIKPKISIVVPVYKVEAYLPKCLNSLISQTYTNIEILLVDDGTPDNSGNICDEYAQKDKRIQVFHIVNKGVSYARNYAMKRATGDYICFVDSDDEVKESYVQHFVEALKKNVYIYISGINIIHMHKSTLSLSLNRKRKMDSHLVTIEIGVVSCTYQWMQLDRLTFY